MLRRGDKPVITRYNVTNEDTIYYPCPLQAEDHIISALSKVVMTQSLHVARRFCYDRILLSWHKDGVVRSTLTRNATDETGPHEDAAIAQCKITPQQDRELVKYIRGPTEHQLPPTRHKIYNFATKTASNKVLKS